jgi:DNA-binding NarL/FixJ family response regulator
MKRPFTTQHLLILFHLSEGKLDKEIAHELNLSPGTISSHLRRLRRRLGARNRTHLCTRYFQYLKGEIE